MQGWGRSAAEADPGVCWAVVPAGLEAGGEPGLNPEDWAAPSPPCCPRFRRRNPNPDSVCPASASPAPLCPSLQWGE